MRRFVRNCAAVLVGVMVLSLSSPTAPAGRIGGAVADTATVAAYQSLYFNIPFAAGEPAAVAIVGDGSTNLDLFMYDGDGKVWAGGGFGDRKAVRAHVSRGGLIRIEVRNLGPVSNTFLIRTN